MDFLINFDAQVILNGTLQVKASSEEEAIKFANEMIKRNLNVEDCMLELGTENQNDDIITIREMALNKQAEIVDIMSIN